MTLAVLTPGLQTTLQDAGRPGLAHLGIGRAGAFDAPALCIANALCGNPPATCALEATLLGPTLRCDRDAWIAVTGAALTLRINGTQCPTWAPVFVRAGSRIVLGPMRAGCRSYLAVRGGFGAAPVLGSRSTDLNAGIGPFNGCALRAGDALAVGSIPGPALPTRAAKWQLDPRPWLRIDPDAPLRMLPGAHEGCLTDASRAALFDAPFRIRTDSNRVGVRLAGPALAWQSPVEMISEGCIPGLVQLPPSGQPIALGPEGPVSGGYPRLGQIAAVDLPRLAQLRPGATLRFTRCTLAEAVHALERRTRALSHLAAAIATRLAQ